MPEAILLLQLEHHHANDLLGLIEQQWGEQDIAPDIGLLQSICDYFGDYPDQCHHPVEDRIFRKLRERDPEAAKSVEPMLADHTKMRHLTRDFAAALAAAGNGQPDTEKALRDSMRRFVDDNRTHMSAEEKNFFPLALATLRERDWSEIDFDLFDRHDPLFDRAEEERYRDLRRRISAKAEQSRRRADHLRRATRLRNLTDIASFNTLMDRTGRDLRLVGYANGSYGLEDRRGVVIDIPGCDEQRAVWCAYYFLARDGDEQTAAA